MALPNLSQIQQELDKMLPKLKPIDLPTGTFCHFHSVPDGWLECNGAAVSRATYADLFKVIGTKYGAGDGSTTFNLPDMNGRVLQATTNHSEVGQMKEASLPNITGGSASENDQLAWSASQKAVTHGALTTELESGWGTSVSSSGKFYRMQFDASKSNAAFNGSAIQPRASLTLLCIKA